MLFGLCSSMERYEQVRDIGYDYIEISGVALAAMSTDEVVGASRRIKAGECPCIRLNSYCDASLPIVGDGFNEIKVRNYAKMICEKGAALGIQAIGIGAPAARKLPEGYDMAIADAQAEQFLRITAKTAAEFGTTVLYESLNTLQCNYGVHTPDILRMVQHINMDNLKIVLDFYQMEMMREDVEDIAYVMPYVGHLHISGFTPEGKRAQLRECDYDFVKKCIDAARRCGYDGTLSVESAFGEFETEAAMSMEILKKCMAV